MNILDLPALYRVNHDVTPGTFKQLWNVAKLLNRFAGGTLDTIELTADLANRWLYSRKESGLSPATVRGNRIVLVMLWKEADELGQAPPLGKVRTVKVPEKIPVAFTREEIVLLIAACKTLRGRFRKVPIRRRVYFESLLNAKYDSALRLSDLLSVERPWIWPGGYVSIVQRKTGHTHRIQFRDSTLALIEECMADWPGRALIWPQFYSDPKRFYEYIRRLVRVAGVRPGTSKWIRRASASYVCKAFGMAAAEAHLGHRTSGLARKSYVDPAIADCPRPLPPPLG